MSEPTEESTRLEVFEFLRMRTALDSEGLVGWDELTTFRRSDGETVCLIGAAGIWKPRQLRFPISVTTAPPKPGRPAPYDDDPRPDGTIHYRYRGSDPDHADNVGLRAVLAQRLPIVYFVGVEKGRYHAFFPTFIVADDPVRRTVTLTITAEAAAGSLTGAEAPEEALRRYVVAAARHRLHQARFRSMVLRAYRCRCAVCSLARRPLLDAAHIIEDLDPAGIAAVRNGLSLCKIHHAAYDQNILGIDPDLRIHIAADVLGQVDGPMLQHGLKDMHGRPLVALPTRREERPDPERIAARFREFRQAQ